MSESFTLSVDTSVLVSGLVKVWLRFSVSFTDLVLLVLFSVVCGLIRGFPRKCAYCVSRRVKINKRSFEPFCVLTQSRTSFASVSESVVSVSSVMRVTASERPSVSPSLHSCQYRQCHVCSY